MPPDRKQISVWINTESAALLSSIAREQGVSLARIIELAIAAYSTSEKTSDCTSDRTSKTLADSGWQSGIEELRGLIASQDVRLNALEVAVMSGITDSSGKARVTLQPADLALAKPVETESDSPSHPAESLSLPPQSQDDFERLVKDTYKECGEKLRKTMEALREKGHRIGQGRLYKILGKKAWAG